MTGDKAALRKQLREHPPAIDHAGICETLLSCDLLQNAGRIMAYYPLPGEVNILPVLSHILSAGKTLLLPRCEDRVQMTARRISALSQLVPGAYHIPEPSPDAPIFPSEQLDLILVPGTAFDQWGHRLGKGMGYYDRFLSGLGAFTIGVCGALLPQIPTDPHDFSMDAVATAAEMIFCRMEGNVCVKRKM